jgi:glutamate N-acetyltransferase/amino-acid N-acetyltransferase
VSEPGAFFTSRWVDAPPQATVAADGALPAGFRASGVPAGLKADGARDLGLIVADTPETTSAARFTRSGVLAAPVLVTRDHARLDALRAVAVNSGNANAATGRPGFDEAARVQGAAGIAARVPTDQVAVCSTGVIGVQLDGRLVARKLVDARTSCARTARATSPRRSARPTSSTSTSPSTSRCRRAPCA